MKPYVLALDQGTTSSRAIVFDRQGRTLAIAQREFEQIYPVPGHVEHDPEAIWTTQLSTAKEALAKARVDAKDVAALGLTNQRETTLLWDRHTGRPVANAIVWQSRITAGICDRLRAEGYADLFRQRTGLVIDAYFSGTKIKYLLDTLPGLRTRAAAGDVLFGTVDSYLIWMLTAGKVHATDVSNASRTLVFNIHTLDWDDELLRILDIPRAMLPRVVPSSGVIGTVLPDFLGAPIPLAGVAGDQQAATFGQACFQPGLAKNTYGTGCFMLMNTGSTPVVSRNQLVTTVGWSLGGQVTYCLEGSVFIAGAVVQWLRDGLGVISSSAEIERLAATVTDAGGVYLVPALVGLGAPHWDPYARGAIFGLTRNTSLGHLARAAVESMAYQILDLLAAMQDDSGLKLESLRVDGGAAVNNQLLQFQADLLQVPVRRPVVAETTALGAAYLAGLAVGVWNGLDDIVANWSLEREFVPSLDVARRDALHEGWQRAVQRSLHWETPGSAAPGN
ncbi:MAG TPA: glycerol kinase GlpK [Gemmatales bacterium]|nr:glycerol kinase GlpK [Gemmatales bacterium]